MRISTDKPDSHRKPQVWEVDQDRDEYMLFPLLLQGCSGSILEGVGECTSSLLLSSTEANGGNAGISALQTLSDVSQQNALNLHHLVHMKNLKWN